MNKFIFGGLTLVLLNSCGYKSAYEAKESCGKWVKDKGQYSGVIKALKETPDNKNLAKVYFQETVNKFPIRRCLKEAETNKIIGLEVTNREENKVYLFQQSDRSKSSLTTINDFRSDWEVKKRFQY